MVLAEPDGSGACFVGALPVPTVLVEAGGCAAERLLPCACQQARHGCLYPLGLDLADTDHDPGSMAAGEQGAP